MRPTLSEVFEGDIPPPGTFVFREYIRRSHSTASHDAHVFDSGSIIIIGSSSDKRTILGRTIFVWCITPIDVLRCGHIHHRISRRKPQHAHSDYLAAAARDVSNGANRTNGHHRISGAESGAGAPRSCIFSKKEEKRKRKKERCLPRERCPALFRV